METAATELELEAFHGTKAISYFLGPLIRKLFESTVCPTSKRRTGFLKEKDHSSQQQILLGSREPTGPIWLHALIDGVCKWLSLWRTGRPLEMKTPSGNEWAKKVAWTWWRGGGGGSVF